MERTDAISDAILESVMNGKSIKQICDQTDMPSRPTFYKWLAAEPAFADRYARACEVRADHVFDEIFDIADNSENDWMERHDSEGANIGWQENGDSVRRCALRIDARKWSLARMQPQKYGEKLDMNLSGGLTVTGVEMTFVRPEPKPKDA